MGSPWFWMAALPMFDPETRESFLFTTSSSYRYFPAQK
jgi:hypothetical protein